MKFRSRILALLLALATGAAFAHGNKVHLMGAVEKIAPGSLFVKTKDGKSVEVKLAASTVYLSRANNQDKPAKLSDLAVGDIVVIHATPKDNLLEADEIKFTVPGAPKAATPSPSKPKS